MPNKNLTIGTHSGCFHCDEALACYLLKLLPRYKDAEIVRSRDQAILDTCDVVVDVGGSYDPSKHRYDHHMRTFKETAKSVIKKPGFDWEIKLSSAGLVFCHFGFEIIKQIIPELQNEDDVELVFKMVYDGLIREIDAIDNGVTMFDGEPRYRIVTNLSARVARLNPQWNSPTDKDHEDDQFRKAMVLVGEEFMDNVQYYSITWLPNRELVKIAIEKRFEVDPSGEILEFTTPCPWYEHMRLLEDDMKITPIKFVLFHDKANYRINAVNVEKGSFKLRMPLPEAWAGLRDADLVKASGIDNCTFVHAERFTGGNSTREGILQMVRKALEVGKQSQ